MANTNTLDEKEGFYITKIYTETDTQIIEGYEYVEIVDEPIDETISEDIVDSNSTDDTEDITDENI